MMSKHLTVRRKKIPPEQDSETGLREEVVGRREQNVFTTPCYRDETHLTVSHQSEHFPLLLISCYLQRASEVSESISLLLLLSTTSESR